jgi:hypothetical protein
VFKVSLSVRELVRVLLPPSPGEMTERPKVLAC